jgi:hypothetical protein
MAPVRPERPDQVEAPAPPAAEPPGPVEAPGEGGPVKIAHGSLYLNPDGSLVLAYQGEGDTETTRRHIPAAVAHMLINGGNPVQMARAMIKAGRNGVD